MSSESGTLESSVGESGLGESALRALLISHEEEAAPAIVGQMLAARGVEIQRHVVLPPDGSVDTAFPPLSEFDLVVAFGSFHNAYDPDAADWVGAEVELIQQTMATETPYLGICFGGQLLGMAVGGSVERAPEGAEEVGVVQDAGKRLHRRARAADTRDTCRVTSRVTTVQRVLTTLRDISCPATPS